MDKAREGRGTPASAAKRKLPTKRTEAADSTTGKAQGRRARPASAKTAAAPSSGTTAASTGATTPAHGPSSGALWRPQDGGVADHLIALVGMAAELSIGLGGALVSRPKHRKVLAEAGALLRDARETAGLTVAQVSAAVDLKDPALLELAESGKAALPVELLLRLAAVLARNDPVPFLMQIVRNYSPRLWGTLQQLGVDGLLLHAGREHEFINIYRSRDAARQLSDAQFAQVLQFTDAAFGMALALVADGTGTKKGTARK